MAFMSNTNHQKCVIYIGDFDLRNQNVQSHLVKNNSKILNKLGYTVAFIGVNKEVSDQKEIESLPKLETGNNLFLEVENTLNAGGLLKLHKVTKRIMSFCECLKERYDITHIISYQAPTFFPILTKIVSFCRKNKISYIVNCADITLFRSQPLLRRIVMTVNWHYLHKVNKKYADGIIAVSSYIEKFYYKPDRPTLILPPLFDENIDLNYNLDDVTTFVHAGFPFAPLKKELTSNHMKDRLDLIVDWFIELSNRKVACKLIVIGLSKETYIKNIPWQKELLENIPEIEFKGRCSHSETLEMVKNSDYMITYRDKNPMTEAGLPTKVVESVSLGTPVIMNEVGDTLSYLKQGISGYKIAQKKEEDIDLLISLCGRTKEERISAKRRCSQLRTFRLDNYKSKVENFLNNVNQLN